MTRMHETREQAAKEASYTSLRSPDSLQRTEAYALYITAVSIR